MAKDALQGEKQASSVAISRPSGFQHQGHMGIGESGGFETRNLPPEMNALLHSLDMQLKNMGQKGITRKEAKILFKAARRTGAYAVTTDNVRAAKKPLPPTPPASGAAHSPHAPSHQHPTSHSASTAAAQGSPRTAPVRPQSPMPPVPPSLSGSGSKPGSRKPAAPAVHQSPSAPISAVSAPSVTGAWQQKVPPRSRFVTLATLTCLLRPYTAT